MKIRHLAILLVLGLWSCSQPVQNEEPIVETPGSGSVRTGGSDGENVKLCKGADISWLTQMEDQGVTFFSKTGKMPEDCLVILKDLGVNAVRLRVWVDPPNKYNTLEDVLEKCRRAEELGMDIMIDFHYSDNWADPGKQTIPARWTGLDLNGLVSAVGEYTFESLSLLKEAGIDVKWIQIGNETTNGMLWPIGKADTNPKNYVMLSNAGSDAAKLVYPDAKVIVHIDGGEKTSTAKWIFNILKNNGGKFDVAGFSLYPEPNKYEEYVANAKATMEWIVATFDKDVMLCEVGMNWNLSAQCKKFLQMCFELVNEIQGDHFLGALYWEPQCYPGWEGYQKGAFNSNHRPTIALDAYSLDYTGVPKVYAD